MSKNNRNENENPRAVSEVEQMEQELEASAEETVEVVAEDSSEPVGDDIDAEIRELLAEADSATEAVSTEIVASEDELADIEASIAAEELKTEAYAAQENDDANADAAVPATSATTATVTSISAARAKRTPGVAGAKPSDALKTLYPNDEDLLKAAMITVGDASEENRDEVLKRVDSLAKKVGDKAVNLLRFRGSPASVQVYTRIGLDLIRSKEDVSSKDLFDAMKAKGYSDGTARAQGNQLMQLFPALGIANRASRGALQRRDDSALLSEYAAATA